MTQQRPTVLVTGATGQIGAKTLSNLLLEDRVTPVAAVRSAARAAAFHARGIRTVMLDFDKEETLLPALQGIDRVLLVTAYSVDMLRQSKVFLDAARQAGVRHVVHLGACGGDDASIGHWAWHQLVERYIEWHGFSFTHLRPEAFMQNLLSYDGTRAVVSGVIRQYTGDARFSWVDGDDVAAVAAHALGWPERHAGQTYRLGHDAKSYGEVAALMSAMLGQPFRYEALSPDVFLEDMRRAGAEMTYMACVADNFRRVAERRVPGIEDTYDDFKRITGRDPVRWPDFIRKHRDAFAY